VILDAVAVRFQLLPEVIDLSFVLTVSGLFAALTALIGAIARVNPDRLARLVVFGNLLGAVVGTIFLLIGVFSR
jgi:hypothetical protein